MTLSIVREEIFRFLESKNAEVLVLKGEWGTGKTFTWKRLLKEYIQHNELPTSRYSYVSLFGSNSLQDFKFLLFQQSIQNSTIGSEASVSSFKENAVGFSEMFGRKGFGLFGSLPMIKGFSAELRSLAFLSLTNTLVCLDDLERKGRGLEVRDILGLVSQLKEEKNCKTVIILNEQGLADSDQEQFELYREKVIDIELAFTPNVDECISVGLESDDKIDQKLKPKIAELGITNIRIIFRIKRLISIILPHLEEYEPELSDQAIHTVVLFCWCYLADDSTSPNYEFVKKSGLALLGLKDDDAREEEKAWTSILHSYQFSSVDEFDLVLAGIVESGYIDPEALKAPLEGLNARMLANKGDKSFEEAWRLYHDSFEDNQDDVIDLIYSRFKENVSYISPLNLNGTVSLLRELGREDLADSCIDHYVSSRSDTPELFNLQSYPFSGEISDPQIRKRFEEAYISAVPPKPLRETVEGIAGKTGWGREDISVMASASEDDYYTLFKGENGPHLHSFVNACLQFKRIEGLDDEERSIAEKAETALRRIAGESAVNRRRVASYGIALDKPAT